MRVIGVDPGSRKIGLAILEGDARRMRPVAFTTARCPEGPLPERLRFIYDEVRDWVVRFDPVAAAVEDVFVARNARSALILGQARGAALLALAHAGLEPCGYATASIKQAVAGHGRAAKPEMRRAVRLQLGLDKDPSEDAADAVAVAMAHLVLAWQRALEVPA